MRLLAYLSLLGFEFDPRGFFFFCFSGQRWSNDVDLARRRASGPCGQLTRQGSGVTWSSRPGDEEVAAR